ncbi:MAG: hypothetical protein ACKO2T_16210, partial [Microcystis aeruginosa]
RCEFSVIRCELSCTEFKPRLGNFSTNAQTASPCSAAPALPCNLNEQFRYSVFQSAEVQKLWVLGTHARGKRQKGRKIGVPH